MPTFKLPDNEHGKELPKLVASVINKYHAALKEAELKVDVLLAFGKPDSEEPALKHHGYPALATMRIRPGKERAQQLGDVQLTVDWVRFSESSTPTQVAVIDHELTHVELQLNDAGVPKIDEYGRPKCKLRLHDRQLGWFDSVAARHGVESIEVDQAADLVDTKELAQTYFPMFQIKSRR